MRRPKAAPTDPIVAAYLEHMHAERTPTNTVGARMRTLNGVGNAGAATREEIEAWWYDRAHLAAATRANDLANLRGFYKWAQIWEHRADDPTVRLKAPRVPNGVPRPVAGDDLLELLNTLEGDLLRAVCLGAFAGLRVSEVARLDWAHVDVVRRRATILGKGGKTRVVGLSPKLLEQLLPDVGGNVVRAGGTPYTPSWLDRKVNAAIADAGVNATFHQLRHFYGVAGYQGVGDLVALAEQMGHGSIQTTLVYARAADTVADRIAEAVGASTTRGHDVVTPP